MDILALVRDGVRQVAALAAEGGEAAGAEPFQINLFWIIVSATTFILFFFLIREFALRRPEQDPRGPPLAYRAGPPGR